MSYGILDGIVCKTQNVTRVLSWILLAFSLVLLVLKMECNNEYELPWRTVVSPLLLWLGMILSSLGYILYGNSVGYFRLTEAQSTAAIFYSMASVGGLGVLGLVVSNHLARPNGMELRVVLTFLAPLTVVLFGLGAWAISRDEFYRLLQQGGQAAVHPMKLKLEKEGWTATESKGVTIIPMFGEVRYEPLDPSQKSKIVELCSCCACYPYEEEEETYVMDIEPSEYPYGSGISQLGREDTGTGITRTPSGIISTRSNRGIA